MRFKTCALACTENVEIHVSGAHRIFDSVEHVVAIGANLIASAENNSRSTVYGSQTLSRHLGIRTATVNTLDSATTV